MHNNLSRLMGISALKTVFRNFENSNLTKPPWKTRIYALCFFSSIYRNMYNNFENDFCDRLIFLLKIKFNYIILVNVFFQIHFNFLRDFSTVFRRFLRKFPIFLETVSALKLPLNATEYYTKKKWAQRWKYKAYDDFWSKNEAKRKKVKKRNF